MELSQHEFELLSKYVYDICGIALGNGKEYLVRHRLEPLVKSGGFPSFLEYYNHLRNNLIPNGRDEIISAITTNETSFFRDRHIFDIFRNYALPELASIIRDRKTRQWLRRGHKVRIWSAGASSGQEAYSIAMLISEYVSANQFSNISTEDFGILATDISSKVLAKAIAGEYNDMEIAQGLPDHLKAKYFRKAGKGTWSILPNIRQMVEYRYTNLMEPFAMLGSFDVIFCRNVLCYFDDETKRAVFEQFHKTLTHEGSIFLGATENVYLITDKFESVRKGEAFFYKRK